VSDRLRELLLKAVHQLDPEEQDEVFAELLARDAAPLIAGAPAHHVMRWLTRPVPLIDRTELTERVSAMVAEAGDLKMLPVRLPTADYDRLRAWSRENGFSMAVIIRSLVERFLDGRDQAARPSPQ
jgi:hypothetical protein